MVLVRGFCDCNASFWKTLVQNDEKKKGNELQIYLTNVPQQEGRETTSAARRRRGMESKNISHPWKGRHDPPERKRKFFTFFAYFCRSNNPFYLKLKSTEIKTDKPPTSSISHKNCSLAFQEGMHVIRHLSCQSFNPRSSYDKKEVKPWNNMMHDFIQHKKKQTVGFT